MGLINIFVDKIRNIFFRNRLKRLNPAVVDYQTDFSQKCRKYVDNEGTIYFDYNAVNTHSGKCIKLQNLSEVANFDNKSHLYTGWMNKSYNSKDKKSKRTINVPVCFITEKKFEDIVKSKNNNEKKKLVDMLSSKKAKKSNSARLNYIGLLDREGKISKNINNQGLLVVNTVNNLKLQYYKNNQKTNEG